jgi:acetyltransferase-like isoleucine patch superfamily enzyme
VGTGLLIQPNVTIVGASGLSIGNNCFINIGTWIWAAGTIKIGDNVIIGPYAVLVSGNHRYDSLERPIRQQGDILNTVAIEDDVWIGAHAVVLPGVTIGEGSVIGAAAVVTSDIPAYSVAVGTPAKVITSRLKRAGDGR